MKIHQDFSLPKSSKPARCIHLNWTSRGTIFIETSTTEPLPLILHLVEKLKHEEGFSVVGLTAQSVRLEVNTEVYFMQEFVSQLSDFLVVNLTYNGSPGWVVFENQET